jgi:SAM-dependent methyltransferase
MAHSFDPIAFRDFEHQGWERAAAAYGGSFGRMTREAIPALLDAAEVRPGMRVLDVACGPGFSTQAAVERGARATGLDFSANMVAEASRHFPAASFRQGEGERLPFADGEWDAVICGFGILHFHDAERAVAEVHRVLVPGGRFAFSCWMPADRNPYFTVIADAIRTHGNTKVPVPPGPSPYRFGDPTECERVLRSAGFRELTFREGVTHARFERAEQLLEMIEESTVRTREVLRMQAPEALPKIEAQIVANAAAYAKDGRIEIPATFLVAAGRKPA